MSTENSFEKTSEAIDRGEPGDRWNTAAARIEKTIDKLGLHIDAGIKEAVIALSVCDIETTASCEGHLEHGIAAPWIDIRAKEMTELSEKIKAAESKKEAEKISGDNAENIERAKEKHMELMKKTMGLLEDFYKDRHVPFDARLFLDSRPAGARLQSQGTFLQKTEAEATKKAKLLEYQKEMRAFTEFLKNKFFEKNKN